MGALVLRSCLLLYFSNMNFPLSRNQWLAGGAVLAIILAVALFFLLAPSRLGHEQPVLPLATTTPNGAITPPSQANAPAYRGKAVAELNPSADFLKQVPPDVYQKNIAELRDIARRLGENPLQPEVWFRVAFIKHFYGDDDGARDVYEYLNVIATSDAVSFYNLAELYGFYLKEPEKAIPKYQTAIRINPQNASFYVGFADFYRTVMNNPQQSEVLLLQGLSAVPNDVNFLTALASNAVFLHDYAKAIFYYEQAVASGKLDANLAASVKAEIEKLKKR